MDSGTPTNAGVPLSALERLTMYYGQDRNVNTLRWGDIPDRSLSRPLDAVYYGDHKLLWRVPAPLGSRGHGRGYYECICGHVATSAVDIRKHTQQQRLVAKESSRKGAVPAATEE